MYQGSVLVLGFNLETTSSVTMNYKMIQNSFPTEIDLCGLIKFGTCSDAEAHMNEILKDVDVTDNPILLTCDAGCENLKASVFKNNKLEEVQFEVVSEAELFKILYYVRLTATFDVQFKRNDVESIQTAVINLRKHVKFLF